VHWLKGVTETRNKALLAGITDYRSSSEVWFPSLFGVSAVESNALEGQNHFLIYHFGAEPNPLVSSWQVCGRMAIECLFFFFVCPPSQSQVNITLCQLCKWHQCQSAAQVMSVSVWSADDVSISLLCKWTHNDVSVSLEGRWCHSLCGMLVLVVSEIRLVWPSLENV